MDISHPPSRLRDEKVFLKFTLSSPAVLRVAGKHEPKQTEVMVRGIAFLFMFMHTVRKLVNNQDLTGSVSQSSVSVSAASVNSPYKK